jgi:glycerol-3-phosphate dehydrogenase
VINATGVFTDTIRRLDEPSAESMLAVSSGAHLVLDRSFLPGDHALMVPKTDDGRVLFAVPWHGHVVVGTTDEPRVSPDLEPVALETEVNFILEHIAGYLTKPVTRADVLSIFTGLRPLVKAGNSAATATLSRDHVIAVSKSGLVTITGGKWTSYRKMAEDAVTRAAASGRLPLRAPATENRKLHGAVTVAAGASDAGRFPLHGSDASALEALIAAEPALDRLLHPRLTYRAVEVVWAARHEMARSVEDVLSRRTRALVLDARAAIEAAPFVSELLARELGQTPKWAAAQVGEFTALARNYLT